MSVISFKLLWGQLKNPILSSPKATSLIYGPTAQALLDMWSSGWGASIRVLPQVPGQKWPSLTKDGGSAKPVGYAPWLLNKVGWGGSSSSHSLWERPQEYIIYDFQIKAHCRTWDRAVLWQCWVRVITLAPNFGGPHGNGKWPRKTTADEEIAHPFIIHSCPDAFIQQMLIENLPFASFSAPEDTWTNYHMLKSAPSQK